MYININVINKIIFVFIYFNIDSSYLLRILTAIHRQYFLYTFTIVLTKYIIIYSYIKCTLS